MKVSSNNTSLIHQLESQEWLKYASLTVLAIFTTVALLTCGDYGYGFDEIWQNRRYGAAVLQFWSTFGEDRTAIDNVGNLYLYGGIYDATAEWLGALLPGDGFGVRRMFNIAAGLATLIGTWRLACLTGGQAAGLVSLLLLATTPAFYGHVFFNAKDIPFAAGYVWSLYYGLRVAEQLPSVAIPTLLKLGLALTLALGIRIGGIVVLGYFGLVLAVAFFRQLLISRDRVTISRWIRQIALAFLFPLVFAAVLASLAWPAILDAPLETLVEAITATSKFSWQNAVLFNGEYIRAMDLPWTYFPHYLLVKLPEIFLLGLVAVPLALYATTRKLLREPDSQQATRLGMILLAGLFPPLYAILKGSTLYDGIRHFLFVLPMLAILAGYSLLYAWQRTTSGNRAAGVILTGVLVVLLLNTVVAMVSLHPFQYVFYNRLGGGMPLAQERYETDYWMTSYKLAAEATKLYAADFCLERNIDCNTVEFTVAVAQLPEGVRPFLPANFKVGRLGQFESPHFYIASSRWNLDHRERSMRPIAEIERLGMVFAVVKTSLPEN